MFSKFKHIRYNVAAFMTALVLVLLLLVWSLVYIYTKQIFTQQILKDNKVIVEKITLQIDNDLSLVQEYADNIIYSDDIQSLMRSYYSEEGYKFYSTANEITKKLAKYSLLKSEIIYDIFILEKDGMTQASVSMTEGDLMDLPWYLEVYESTETNLFSAAHTRAKNTGPPEKIISYISKFNNLDSPESRLGTLVINLNYSAIFSKLNTQGTDSKNFYIVTPKDEIIFSATPKDYGGRQFDYDVFSANERYDADGFIYITLPIDKLDYILIAEIPKDEIGSSINQIYKVILLLIALSLIVTVALIFPFSKKITDPIIALSGGMNDVAEGNFDRSIKIDQENELKEMATSFNNMTYRIKKLLSEIEDSHQKEKEMQIKLFMSKINPHFIYNTLYSIVSLASRDGSKDIGELTKAFINILRRNIVVDEKDLSIKNEMEYLDNYIFILKYQYGDSISLRCDVDESLMDLRLRPMILYPLVENSIFHGITPKNEKGTVYVSIKRRGEWLDFSVSDDGIGMDEAQLAALKQHLMQSTSNGHIGLKSVYDRLIFFYGQSSEFTIKSEYGKGTVVTFSIIPEKD